MAIERAAGVGTRIGRSDIGRLADCPHYITINRTFRLIHTCMAGGNVVTIICTVIHLMYMISCPDTAVRG
ncbi:Hypothetical protein CINCED_3A010045 [Cinara cedri]|uniref:Uncharacterized protein n=1 Tax=Cinara cedri TaxID=506608 RepID=A0A5E4M4U7_9HEMI|nr:Hypothetical protein CINCED_3A010045 [Cinara cedri]